MGRTSGQVLSSGEAVDVAVGQRLRALRLARGLSLEKVAASTGVSIGFLSQVERGLSSPSLRMLALLADTLQTGLAGLFGGETQGPDDAIVTREQDRPNLWLWRAGITKQLLTPSGTAGGLSLFRTVLEPRASTGDDPFSHDGEEAGLVLEGDLVLTVESRTLRLVAGDSFRFASRRPHHFANPSATERTIVLWVNAIPANGA
ncbi:cupin domain-containing protein [Methylobacterium planeticum]|uniref:Cupin domain-containing protein n=1 Tax=Methylobacterium planeticum TaxID=2615211 RepID=A0A6N6MJL4_9HYPH|nr:cupin domain-containing protein [Methylobacterium planeticum]KAB1070282.1 cupin domain-containing protein [Methylobacterium planeticum]